jgi:hypothetical protein
MNKEQFDERMDELSREAALLQSLPFKEEAWEKMEQLLDKKEKRRRFIFWWWLTPLLLLLTITGFYFLTTSNNKQTVKTEKGLLKREILSEQKNSTADNLSKRSTETNLNFKEPISETKIVTQSIPNATKGHRFKKSVLVDFEGKNNNGIYNKQRSKRSNKKEDFIIENPAKKVFTDEKKKESTNTLSSTKKADKEDSSQKEYTNLINNESKKIHNDTLNTTSKKEALVVIEKKQVSKDSSKEKVDSTVEKLAKKEKKKKVNSLLSKFEVSAAASADISSIQFKKADKISTAYGIGISYFISNKLSLSTGIGFAKKIYNADSADYNGLAYLPWSSTLKNIYADCRVTEIPINIQYQFKENKNSSWLVAIGLSNYFMKSETYVYDYTYYGISKTYTYNYQKQNNHILSVLNLAIAYRKKISTQLSWQLSPFAKLPLTGIGQGKVQLSSFGVQGSLHFKLKK